ncbi:MAG: META domain-containing protein [Rikenellaceae bacterium]
MKRVFLTFVVALSVALTLSCCCACRSGNASRDIKLGGTTWQVEQIGSSNFTPTDDKYTITFGEDGKVNGLAECNRFFGDYATSDKKELKFDHMGMTRMMCPQPDREDLFTQMLGKVTHYAIDGKTLILLNNGESVALLRKVER